MTRADIEAGRDRAYPLHVRVCGTCFLVQADEVVSHADIFGESYMYFSSYATTWVAHAKRYQEAMTARFGLGAQSRVVEVASNDGYLLQHFVAAGIPVLGVEPTAGTQKPPSRKACRRGSTISVRRSRKSLASEGFAADLTAANNVLAHVPDILDFARGFAEILKPEGVATFEFPHLLNLIRLVQFDTIYHEHYSYLSLLAVEAIFARAGLRVFDVESFRRTAARCASSHAEKARAMARRRRSQRLRAMERAAQLDKLEGYRGFQPRIEACGKSFRAFLAKAKAQGKSVAAYGAAAKGNTFFNVFGITAADIPMIGDRSHAKQGKFLPGSHIPIVSPDALEAAKPDYLIVVPWNLIDEIREQFADLGRGGTRFVTAIPDTRVV